jgi:outer membrane protein assembly factor BamB
MCAESIGNPQGSYSSTSSLLTLKDGVGMSVRTIRSVSAPSNSEVPFGSFSGGDLLADDVGGIAILGGIRVDESTEDPKFMYVPPAGSTSIVPRPNFVMPEAVGEGGVGYGSNELGEFVAVELSSGDVLWDSPVVVSVVYPNAVAASRPRTSLGRPSSLARTAY